MDIRARLQRSAQWLQHRLRHNESEEGWGQFVEGEGPDAHQIGWYGTSAGIGTLGLSDVQPPSGALEWLANAWDARANSSKSAAHVSQTARLSITLLALTRTAELRAVPLKQEIVQDLLGRRLPDGTWGEWHASPEQKDPRTSGDISALAIIALHAQPAGQVTAHELDRSAKALVKYVQGIERTDPEALLLPLSAIALTLKKKEWGRSINRLMKRALRYRPHPDDALVVMYNYGYEFGGKTEFGRDYILVPKIFPYLMLSAAAVGFFGPLHAAHGVSTAAAALPRDTDYLFGRGRLSATLDQFLVAHGLFMADAAAASAPRGFASAVVWLWQSENVLVRLSLPVIALSVAAIAAADPLLFSTIPCAGWCLPDPTPFKGVVRALAILFMTFAGRPLLDAAWAYIELKRGVK